MSLFSRTYLVIVDGIPWTDQDENDRWPLPEAEAVERLARNLGYKNVEVTEA